MMTKQLIIEIKRTNPHIGVYIKKIEDEVKIVYNIPIDYIEKWTSQLDRCKPLNWITLRSVSEWTNIEKTILYFNEKNRSVYGNKCFPEFIHMKNGCRCL